MNIQELVNNSWAHAAERHAPWLGVSDQSVLRMWETLLFWLLVQWSDTSGARQLSDVSVYVPNSGFYCCHGEVRRRTRMRKGGLKGCCRAFFQVLEKVFQVFWLWSGKAEEELWKERNEWMKEISLTHANIYKSHLTPSSPAYVHASSHWVPLVGTTCIPSYIPTGIPEDAPCCITGHLTLRKNLFYTLN